MIEANKRNCIIPFICESYKYSSRARILCDAVFQKPISSEILTDIMSITERKEEKQEKDLESLVSVHSVHTHPSPSLWLMYNLRYSPK